VNVVDATALERNLFFTLRLFEMETPLVIALNLVDVAKKKGITIDEQRLQQLLGAPVVPTIATKGIGVHEITDASIKQADKQSRQNKNVIRYGPEIEKRIEKLERVLAGVNIGYPSRWTAIKLLEGDSEIVNKVSEKHPDVIVAAYILLRKSLRSIKSRVQTSSHQNDMRLQHVS
jgi:ferrous iron transport protein B